MQPSFIQHNYNIIVNMCAALIWVNPNAAFVMRVLARRMVSDRVAPSPDHRTV